MLRSSILFLDFLKMYGLACNVFDLLSSVFVILDSLFEDFLCSSQNEYHELQFLYYPKNEKLQIWNKPHEAYSHKTNCSVRQNILLKERSQTYLYRFLSIVSREFTDFQWHTVNNKIVLKL